MVKKELITVQLIVKGKNYVLTAFDDVCWESEISRMTKNIRRVGNHGKTKFT